MKKKAKKEKVQVQMVAAGKVNYLIPFNILRKILRQNIQYSQDSRDSL